MQHAQQPLLSQDTSARLHQLCDAALAASCFLQRQLLRPATSIQASCCLLYSIVTLCLVVRALLAVSAQARG